jgi:hypothetical protein
VAAALPHSRPAYSALDLPRPRRQALAFALLAVAALALDADPELPWAAGAVAAALFATAGAVRSVRAHRELLAVRRAADRLIVGSPTSRDASELVHWRCAELTTRSSRDGLRREVDRILSSLDPSRLPSASPLRRPAVRGCRELFVRLGDRLGDEQPVAARGILLARALLRDAASPLYSDGPELGVAQAARRVLGALEP